MCIQRETCEEEQQPAAGRSEAQASLEERDCLSTAARNMSQQQCASLSFAQGLEQARTGHCTRPSPHIFQSKHLWQHNPSARDYPTTKGLGKYRRTKENKTVSFSPKLLTRSLLPGSCFSCQIVKHKAVQSPAVSNKRV